MPYPIADTHTHLYFASFDKDQDRVIQTCEDRGVQMQVQIGCDEVSSLASLDLAKKHDHFYATLGVHPCDVKTCFNIKKNYRPTGYEDYKLKSKNFDDLFSLFDTLAKKNPEKVVGFGETGFDLYHENSKEIYHLQTECLERHVELSQKHKKPLIFHIRNARKEFEAFIKSGHHKECRGVIHCFSEDANWAYRMTADYGFFLGIGGVATYSNAQKVRDAITDTPIEFLVTETDSPFLVPHNARKQGVKRNDASYIPEVVQLIAHLKNMDEAECGEILFQNAKRLYQI